MQMDNRRGLGAIISIILGEYISRVELTILERIQSRGSFGRKDVLPIHTNSRTQPITFIPIGGHQNPIGGKQRARPLVAVNHTEKPSVIPPLPVFSEKSLGKWKRRANYAVQECMLRFIEIRGNCLDSFDIVEGLSGRRTAAQVSFSKLEKNSLILFTKVPLGGKNKSGFSTSYVLCSGACTDYFNLGLINVQLSISKKDCADRAQLWCNQRTNWKLHFAFIHREGREYSTLQPTKFIRYIDSAVQTVYIGIYNLRYCCTASAQTKSGCTRFSVIIKTIKNKSRRSMMNSKGTLSQKQLPSRLIGTDCETCLRKRAVKDYFVCEALTYFYFLDTKAREHCFAYADEKELPVEEPSENGHLTGSQLSGLSEAYHEDVHRGTGGGSSEQDANKRTKKQSKKNPNIYPWDGFK